MMLQNPYNQRNYLSFFKDEMLPEDFVLCNENILLDFQLKYFSRVTYLGECPSLDLNIYEIRHTSVADARVGLSRDAFKLVSRYDKNNALILFVPQDESNYRLSLVTIEPKLDESGAKIKYEYSNPKRYSFFLGKDAKIHTPHQYLINYGRIRDIEDLKKRFSVEVVNKEFYSLIAELFSRLVGGKRKKGNKIETYQPELKLPSRSIEQQEQEYKEFAVRLIGRTVFCWFLKNKKSAKGIPLIPDEALSIEKVNTTTDFYHSVIEPLFFRILNTPVEQRAKQYKTPLFDTIPFLNGGLFEPQNDDFFTNNKPNYALQVPDDWFKRFITILNTYNFTIDENTSIDIDLSVDPEMLGRIFENLLAEINPETGETARKSTGSYYTPRPIVEYMVNESLKQYLITTTNIEEHKLDGLLDYSIEASGLTDKEEKAVIKAFDTIKILDPACGSGAFPMGMLQKMLLVLQKVDHEAINSIQKILDEIPDPVKRKLVEAKLKAANISDDDDLDDYARKLSVIQRSIYGVDIQPIATDISKLRFFLSLIVDEVIQDSHPNRGIEPLPNLEFKFVCANTLIPLPNEEITGGGLFEDRTNIEKLEKIREDFFISFGKEKETLRNEFKKVQKDMLKHSLKVVGDSTAPEKSKTHILSSWNPFANETTNWFDAKWMFGVESGFDIVIGNPPYIQLQKDNGNLADLYKDKNFETFKRTGDIYILFYEKAFKLLNKKGCLCFITSSQWAKATYGKPLREFFLLKNPLKLIFLGPGVFEGATVDTNILIAENATNQNILKGITIEKPGQIEHLPTIEYYPVSFFASEKWILNNPQKQKLKNKIEIKGKSLKEWDLNVYFGIKTGYNEAFIIDKSKRDSIVSKDAKSNEIIKPILRGRGIKKYISVWKDDYIINTHNGVKQLNISKIEINDYKVIKQYLDSFVVKLVSRADQGDTYYNLRNCAYIEEFKKEKIIWKRIGSQLRFSYSDEEIYCLDSTCIATGEKIKYLTALLNSKLCNYQLNENAPRTGMGDLIISVQALEPLKVYFPDPEFEKMIVQLVTQIIDAKKNDSNADTSYLENQIDLLIYKRYDLTYDEIKIIDPGIKKIISKKDYENKTIEELAQYKMKIEKN